MDPEDVTNLRTLVKDQGSFNLVSEYGVKGPVLKPQGLEPKYYSLIFYSSQNFARILMLNSCFGDCFRLIFLLSS